MSFPFTLPEVPEHASPIPEAADVVIVGGGIIGVCAGFFLARKGLRAVLLEKGRIAAEQSSRNWGWIRVQGRDPAEVPIMLEARRHWAEFDAASRGLTGLVTSGVTYLANRPEDVAGFEDWLKSVEGMGTGSRLLSRAETAALFDGAQADWPLALHNPTDQRAEPWVAAPEIARLAAREGLAIREQCAVRGLETTGGRVSGVVTEHGSIRTGSVILAGGAWSSLFLRRHGVSIPQLAVRSTLLATNAVPDVHRGNAVDRDFAFRRRADGGYTLAPGGYSELYLGPDAFRHFRVFLRMMRAMGDFNVRFRFPPPRGFPDGWGTSRRWSMEQQSPFERMRILNPAPNRARAEDARARFARAFPQLGEVGIKATWGGMIDVMPDVVPVVDTCAALPGLTIATGMCGHGFGIGPAFGRIAADLATGGVAGHDLSRFRMARFTDGTELRPGPAI